MALAYLLLTVFSGPRAMCQQPPHNPKAIFDAAQSALNARDYDKAEQGFREVLRIDPHSAAARKKFEDTVSGKLPAPQSPRDVP